MPKESLPIPDIGETKEKIKKLLKDKINPDPDFDVGGANLLYKSESLQLDKDRKQQLLRYYESPLFVLVVQILIVFTTIVFLFVTLINFIYNSKIEAKQELLAEKVNVVATMTDSLEDLTALSRKVNIYKEYKESPQELTPYVRLFSESSSGFNFVSFELDPNLASFSGYTKSPLTFSLMTSDYLSSGLVESVVLKSAKLDALEEIYELTMEVNLK